MIIRLDNQPIKTPTSFDPEVYKITEARRLANGDMAMDYITKKLKFALSYTVLSGPELDTIIDILMSPKSFYNLEYEWNGQVRTAVVYVGAIKANKFRTDGKWYWKNVNFALIER